MPVRLKNINRHGSKRYDQRVNDPDRFEKVRSRRESQWIELRKRSRR